MKDNSNIETLRPANYSMHLTDEMREKIKAKVATGHYSTMSHVIYEALNQFFKTK